jgi:ubiquinone/menaquinone biosynthesis C-methylase UbiE
MAVPPQIIRTCEPVVCCDPIWEKAYLQFESPDAEQKKFRRRLERLGAGSWPRQAQVVEIFCGRGNGLCALAAMGFDALEGVDLSEHLLAEYQGRATLYVADCRQLPLPNMSRDVVVVQGGLHHLPKLPDDLEAVLREVRRVLRPGGRIVMVEPWLTPFLRSVHLLARQKAVQRVSRQIAAFATMVERERDTYFAWLALPETILNALADSFRAERLQIRWGKIEYVGTRN